MMKIITWNKFLVLLLLTFGCFASLNGQTTEESKQFQEELNKEYADKETSPLTDKGLKKFKELPFFPIDKKYIVVAKFERVQNATPFKMSTTTDRQPTYVLYGVATFSIDGVAYQLNIYQSHKLREMEEYKSHLFLPFTDLTCGVESYGGGRFIDLEIPEGDEIIIDFNRAYNPYCAYNHKYSCPIPPAENDLKVEIHAGVMHSNKKH
jgi:uncharacterized protein (DUF1684 family)